MTDVQFIIPIDQNKLLDLNRRLRDEVVEWLGQMGGEPKAYRPSVHFITCPPHWWYERHPRTDIGITKITEMVIQAEQTWDVFTFINPSLATLFKLTWL